MKKILIFSQAFEPACKGGGVPQSIVNLVKNLGHIFQFYVITLNHEYRAPDELLAGIESNVWTDFHNKANVIYLAEDVLSFQRIKSLIKEIQPDFIYLNGFHELYFVLVPLYYSKKLHIPTIMAPRGLLHVGALSIKPFKKKSFLRLFKIFNMHKKVRWHATDEQEVLDVHKIFGKSANVILAKDTPDLAEYEVKPVIKNKNSLKLVTISLLAPKKNHLLVLETLSKLDYTIEYDIYGHMYDPQYWQSCQRIIETLPGNIRVSYKGGIQPKEVNVTLSKYHFFILPTLGENFGHVIFETLNAGRPPIISNTTPWSYIENHQAGMVISLDKQDDLKQAITKAYQMEQTEFDRYSAQAYKVARNYVKDSNLIAQYSLLFI